MAVQQFQNRSIGSAIGILLVQSLLLAAQSPSQVRTVPAADAVMIPEPKIVLRDSVVTAPSSTITVDPSGRSGTFSVSGGSKDNLVLDVAFTPEGRSLLAGRSRGQLEVWDTNTWMKVLTKQADLERVTAIATSPDGQSVATGGDEQVVKLWRIVTGKLMTKLPKCKDYPKELVFSPDGSLLAVNVNGGPDFAYDLAKGSVVKELACQWLCVLEFGRRISDVAGDKAHLLGCQDMEGHTRTIRSRRTHLAYCF